MPAPLINFPLSLIVDGILSYIQWIFGNPDLTPAEYRWNVDDRKSLIRICGPFVIDNEKPMSAPFIVVERGGFAFANMTLDNLKSSDGNTFENQVFSDWMDGVINIIIGSGSAGEASSIANFLAIMFQADRHGLKKALKFVRNLNYLDVSPEVPVVKDTEIRRWEVTFRLNVSLQQGWIKKLTEAAKVTFNKMSLKQVSDFAFSAQGIITEGSDLLVDPSKNFGFLTTNDPQFLEKEFERGWYYIKLRNNEYDSILKIVEIVDNHTLRLQFHDANDDPIPWSAPASITEASYDIYWNNIHLQIELPTNS